MSFSKLMTHRQLWLLFLGLSLLLGSGVRSQPKNPTTKNPDSSASLNSNDHGVVPLFKRTEGRNPINQVLGIEFGKTRFNTILHADSFTRASLGIPENDTAGHFKDLNDLIRTFQDMFIQANDSGKTLDDSTGTLEEQFHFVSINEGMAYSPSYQLKESYWVVRRRKD